MDLPTSDDGTQNAITLNMSKTPEFPAAQAIQTDDDISEFRSLLMKVPDRYRSNEQWNALRDCDIALGMVTCQYEETRTEAASRVRRHLAALNMALDITRLAKLSGSHELVNWIAQAQQVWVLYLSTRDDLSLDFGSSPVPFLSEEDRLRLTCEGYMLLIHSSKEEVMALYAQVVGEDGPTSANPYTGKHRVYAYVAGPRGGITENT